MKTYKVKEIFYTIQGEGHHCGHPAVFCRFSGCNLWNGKESHRQQAICNFCDTDFVGTDGMNGGKYTADSLVTMIRSLWPNDLQCFVVLTGGEPMLQVDAELIQKLHDANIYIAIETNGTIAVPNAIDWICVSPKGNSEIVQTSGDELKLVFPQPEISPSDFVNFTFKYFYIQPLQNNIWHKNTLDSIEYVKANPTWNLSFQAHKYLDIP